MGNTNKNVGWHNKNECKNFNKEISNSVWRVLPDVECSEVVLFSSAQDFFISDTEDATGIIPFKCKVDVYHTIKGISNLNELSAKGAASVNTLYGRTQSYMGYTLAAG